MDFPEISCMICGGSDVRRGYLLPEMARKFQKLAGLDEKDWGPYAVYTCQQHSYYVKGYIAMRKIRAYELFPETRRCNR